MRAVTMLPIAEMLVLAYALVGTGLSCAVVAVSAVVDGNHGRTIIAGIPALALVIGGLLISNRRLRGPKNGSSRGV